MSQFDDYKKDFNEGTKYVKWTFWKALSISVVLFAALGGVGFVFGWFGEATGVAQKEFGAKAALAKYEWFKDQNQRIRKAHADIETFRVNVETIRNTYETNYGKDHSKWPLHAQVQFGEETKNANSDLIAVISNYNNLVRDYNAASSKFNWAPFRSRDDMPEVTLTEFVTR